MTFKEKLDATLNIKFDKAFGLDISDRSVEIMEMSKVFTFAVDTYGRAELPAGIIENGVILNKDILVESIKKLLKGIKPRKISTNKVVLSLPESQVFTHSFVVDLKVKNSELLRVINDEVSSILPVSLNKMYWDFEAKNLPDNKTKLIMFVGVAKEIAQDYVKLCNSIGLEVVSLSLESFSVARAILKKSDKQSLIIDIGSKTSSIAIFDSNDRIALSVNVPVAGENFTKAIAAAQKISDQDAEALKIKWGFKKDAKNPVEPIIEPILIKEILIEVKTAMDYYEAHFKQNVDQIYLVGGSSMLPGIAEVVKNTLSKQLQIIFVGDVLKLKTLSDRSGEVALFANVIGLAMFGASGGYRDINLLNKMPSSEVNVVNKLSLFNMGYLSKVNALRSIIDNKFVLVVVVLAILVVFAVLTQQIFEINGLKDPISTMFGL